MNGFPERAELMRRFVGKTAQPTPDRLAAVDAAWFTIKILVSQGWKRRAWHPTSPGSPCVVREEPIAGYRYPTWDSALTGGWFDHPYRLISPEGVPIFVSEPYGFGGDAFTRLQYLRDTGWDVWVRPEHAMHYPGRTVAIWIRRKGGER